MSAVGSRSADAADPGRGAVRRRALLALVLLVPAPSLGAFVGMIWLPDTRVGALCFTLAKVWILLLPLVWHLVIDRERPSLSPARHGGFTVAVISGILISGIILVVYALWGDRLIDAAFLRERVAGIGLADPVRYAAGAVYWVLVNAVLEEYVWRWFVVRKCEALLPPRAAVVASAACFTLHHIVAMQVYFGAAAVAVCAAGVFIGGVIWSWMVVRYRSIWPGYVSHAIVDVCIFGIGAWLLFG